MSQSSSNKLLYGQFHWQLRNRLYWKLHMTISGALDSPLRWQFYEPLRDQLAETRGKKTQEIV